jgi:MFS family permease
MSRLRILDSLRVRGFRFYWFSAIFVAAARSMQGVVLGWLVLERTNSAFLVTVAGAFNFLPMLVMGLFSGVVADRLNRRKVLIGTQITSAIASIVLATLIITNLIQTWEIMVLTLVVGLAWALDWPCRQIFIADLAGEQNILNGVALDQWAFNSMSVIGSIVAGIIIATLGMGNAYFLIAGAYLFAAVSLFMIGRIRQTRRGSVGKIMDNVKAGVKYVISNRAILGVLLIMIVAHLTLFPFRQLLSVFARDVLKTGPEGLGYLSAAPGIGAILGGLIMASLRRSRPSVMAFAIAAVVMALLTIVFAISKSYLFSVLLLATVGFATSIYGALQTSIPLVLGDPQMRGRIMGLLSLVVGLMPLGMMVFGIITDRVGAPTVTVVGSIIGVALITGVLFLVPGLRHQGRSTPTRVVEKSYPKP